MNRKLTLILALLFLALISVSIVAAVNETQDSLAADDNSDDKVSQDNDDEKIAVDDKPVLGVEKFSVKMKWDDDNNAASKRPQTVTVVVNVGEDTKDVVLSEGNQWQDYVTGVGNVDENSISLQDVKVDGYTTQISGNPKDGYVITNTYIDDSDDNSTNTTDDSQDDSTDDNSDKSDDNSDKTDDKNDHQPKDEVKIIKKTTTTTKQVPVQKEAKKEPKKTKDKHNAGNPILLGVLAISVAGLAVQLRRRE